MQPEFPVAQLNVTCANGVSKTRQPFMATCAYMAVFLKKKPNATEPTDREMDPVVAVVAAARVVEEEAAVVAVEVEVAKNRVKVKKIQTLRHF